MENAMSVVTVEECFRLALAEKMKMLVSPELFCVQQLILPMRYSIAAKN